MSALTPKRVFLFVVAALLTTVVQASNPSPRTHARMVYIPTSDAAVLFGGRVGIDARGTGLAYASDETWLYSGKRWVQRFPAHSPEPRSVHSMVYDSKRDRVLMFGGRSESDDAKLLPPLRNDMWAWNGEDWSPVETSQAPSARDYSGMAYDSAADRVVLFGGEKYSADGKTVEPLYDTWEFDGADWSLIESAGAPKVARPILAYDPVRNQVVMLGLGDLAVTVMYGYDRTTRTWIEVKPENLPPCVSEGLMEWRPAARSVLFTGGICAIDNSGAVETFSWDGTNWTKLELNDPGRASGQAFTIDTRRDTPVMFGGTNVFSAAPRSVTVHLKDGVWRFSAVIVHPGPRSLAGFSTDSARGAIWLFGGLIKDSDSSYFVDEFWRYQNGQWNPMSITNTPTGCTNPLTAFDTDRGVLVVTCNGEAIFEYNGTEWKAFTLTSMPKARRFAGMVYDANIRKTVLFGGYDGVDYRRDTWTWDGTKWTEVKNDRPTHRGQMAMWYDPLMKKTVVFGGIGRASIDDKVVRYDDMWAFSGSGWTKLTVTATPGERFGPQVATDPRTGKVLLLGGLRAEKTGETYKQYYTNDFWQWDGSANTWTRLTPAILPSPRENGMFGYDPVSDRMVLFGGYIGGLYYSDVWEWDGTTWTPRETPIGRHRAAGGS